MRKQTIYLSAAITHFAVVSTMVLSQWHPEAALGMAFSAIFWTILWEYSNQCGRP